MRTLTRAVLCFLAATIVAVPLSRALLHYGTTGWAIVGGSRKGVPYQGTALLLGLLTPLLAFGVAAALVRPHLRGTLGVARARLALAGFVLLGLIVWLLAFRVFGPI